MATNEDRETVDETTVIEDYPATIPAHVREYVNVQLEDKIQ